MLNSKKYCGFLSMCFLNRVVTQKSLNILVGNKDVASKYIKYALDNKHISVLDSTYKRKRQKIKKTYYVITKTGIKYLWKNFYEQYAVSVSNLPARDCYILKANEYSSKPIQYAIANETAISMCMKAGAYIDHEAFRKNSEVIDMTYYPEEFEDNPEEWGVGGFVDSALDQSEIGKESYRGYLIRMIDDKTLDQFIGQQKQNPSDEDFMLFRPVRALKKNAESESVSSDSLDFARARMRGVLDSYYNSMVVFIEPPIPMSWYKFNVNAERSVARMWNVSNSFVKEEYKANGILKAVFIAENPTSFYRSYSAARNDVEDEALEFGGYFSNVYVVPNSQEGVNQLHWIMLSNEDEEKQILAEAAIKTGQFVFNEQRTGSDYLLRDKAGNEVIIGFHMDAKKMLQYEKVANAHPAITYYILCYKWQKSFYEKIMPNNIKYYSIG